MLLTILLVSLGAALTGVLFFVLFEERSLLEIELKGERGEGWTSSSFHAALRWVRSELAAGRRPRAAAGTFSDFKARRVFTLDEGDGVETSVYDLDYDAQDATPPIADARSFFPRLEGGLLIRTWREGEGPRLLLEAAYLLRTVELPGGASRLVLEEKPCMWREIWR